MDSMRSPHSPHRVLMESMRTLWRLPMDSMWSPWILEGLHCSISYYFPIVSMDSLWTLCGVYGESMETPHGLLMDLQKFMDSMDYICGLLMDSTETPHGFSVHSPWTASLIYLIKMKFNHYKNKCPQHKSNSEPFGRCITAH